MISSTPTCAFPLGTGNRAPAGSFPLLKEKHCRQEGDLIVPRRIMKRGSITTAVAAVVLLLVSVVGHTLPEPLPDPWHEEPSVVEIMRFSVDSKASAGKTVTLEGGRYRILARGQYTYGGPAGGPFWADVECSFDNGKGVWVRNQHPLGSPGGDHLDMYVDGRPLEWTPSRRATSGTPVQGHISSVGTPECDQRDVSQTDHEYHVNFTWKGGDLSFRFEDANHADNNGSIEVIIFRPGERPQEELIATLVVPANLSSGVDSPPLVVGQTYRLEVSGSYRYAPGRKWVADAECSMQLDDPVWRPKFSHPQVVNGDDLLDLHVNDHVYNGVADGNVSWVPLSGSGLPGTCATDEERAYSLTYTAMDPLGLVGREVTRLNLRVSDQNYLDNLGALTVKLFLVVGLPRIDVPSPEDVLADPPSPSDPPDPAVGTPAPPSFVPLPQAPEFECVKDASGGCMVVDVPADASEGVVTPLSLSAGHYRIEATGVYQYEVGVHADAECSTGPLAVIINQDPTWQRNRHPHADIGGDALDLLIADSQVEWAPKGRINPTDCHDSPDPQAHTYFIDFTWEGDEDGDPAPISFKVFDPGDYSRNTGNIKVRLFRPKAGADGELLSVVFVNSSDPSGSFTPTLLAGSTYRLVVKGSYTYYRYSSGDFDADAECSTKGDFVFGDATKDASGWHPKRFADLTGEDPLDLYVTDLFDDNGVNDGSVTWMPKIPGDGVEVPTACADDEDRTYSHTFTAPDTSPLNLKVFEQQTDWYTDNIGVLSVQVFLLD